MFVCSVRSSTIKFFAVIILTLAVVFSAVALSGRDSAVYASAAGREINYGGIKTNEDRLEFIRSFGLEVESQPTAEEQFSLPDNFDRVISGYNEIQKTQGLNLTKYAGKKVTHYAYTVKNYNFDGKVEVNLIIHRNKIIACDISSTEQGGFVLPLVGIDPAKLKNDGN